MGKTSAPIVLWLESLTIRPIVCFLRSNLGYIFILWPGSHKQAYQINTLFY